MPEVISSKASLRITTSLAGALKGRPVAVGTENRAKCDAVRDALSSLQPLILECEPSLFAEIEIRPLGVPSGVSEQPCGFDEIVAGARNRARAALASGACALAVGIEDGLVELPDGLGGESVFNLGCAWVTDGEREGSGFSSGFAYPAECLIPATRDREPIGDLFDAHWRRHRDSGGELKLARDPNLGNIGKLTGGRLTRSDYASHAVLCALVRFLQRDLYD